MIATALVVKMKSQVSDGQYVCACECVCACVCMCVHVRACLYLPLVAMYPKVKFQSSINSQCRILPLPSAHVLFLCLFDYFSSMRLQQPSLRQPQRQHPLLCQVGVKQCYVFMYQAMLCVYVSSNAVCSCIKQCCVSMYHLSVQCVMNHVGLST